MGDALGGRKSAMRPRLRFALLVLLVGATALTASPASAALASPDPTGSWGAPIVVTEDAAFGAGDFSNVSAISCAAAGDCSAVGTYSGTPEFGGTRVYAGFVVDETNGTWGSAQLIGSDDSYRFRGISCASAGNCAAVGQYTGSGGGGFIMDEVGGVWGSAQVVAPTLTSVSCPTAGECTAVGTGGYGGQAFVVSEAAGVWGTPQALTGSLDVDAGLTSVSCASAGNCAAGGFYDAQPYGPLPGVGYVLVAEETNGTWSPAQTVTGSFTTNGDIDVDTVTSVSCSSAGNCSAAGYDGTFDGQSHAFVVSLVNDSWQTAVDIGGSLAVEGGWLSSISCRSDGNCSAVGYYLDRVDDVQALVVSEVSGTWQSAQEAFGPLNVDGYAQLSSISCVSAGNCSAGGYYANSAGAFIGAVVTEVDGTWSSGTAVATSVITDGLAQVNAISCPSVGNCAVGGVIDNADSYQVAFVAGETPAPPSPVLSVSAPGSGMAGVSIGAGSIGSTVSGGSSPTGTVTFKVFGPEPSAPASCAGGTIVGSATIAGDGSYSPGGGFTPTSAGDYWWYASYGGDAGNNPAASTCGAGMAETDVLPVPVTGTGTGASGGTGAPPVSTEPPPVSTRPPAITGTAKAGVTLTCSLGGWRNLPTSVTYQWYRNGTPLANVTGPSYTVGTLDEGTTLTCVVTASNAGGSTTANTNAVKVPVPVVPHCPAATGVMTGTTIGQIRLGMTRGAARYLYRHHSNRGKEYEDFFCLTPIGVRVGYASPILLKALSTSERARVTSRVVWASTSNPYYSLDGIRPGESITMAAPVLDTEAPFHIGLNYWYLARKPGYTAVLKVRGNIVQELGIATNALTSTRAAQSVLMHSFY